MRPAKFIFLVLLQGLFVGTVESSFLGKSLVVVPCFVSKPKPLYTCIIGMQQQCSLPHLCEFSVNAESTLYAALMLWLGRASRSTVPILALYPPNFMLHRFSRDSAKHRLLTEWALSLPTSALRSTTFPLFSELRTPAISSPSRPPVRKQHSVLFLWIGGVDWPQTRDFGWPPMLPSAVYCVGGCCTGLRAYSEAELLLGAVRTVFSPSPWGRAVSTDFWPCLLHPPPWGKEALSGNAGSSPGSARLKGLSRGVCLSTALASRHCEGDRSLRRNFSSCSILYGV